MIRKIFAWPFLKLYKNLQKAKRHWELGRVLPSSRGSTKSTGCPKPQHGGERFAIASILAVAAFLIGYKMFE